MEVRNLRQFRVEPLNDNAPKVLREAIEKLKVKYWMSAGTALGLYRDKDFIEGDTDIDIAMLGYENVGGDLEKILGWEVIREVKHEGRLQQIAFMKDDVIFDIYLHWEEGDNYVNVAESGKQVMPKWMYDEPTEIETKYGVLPFPKDPEEYFKIRYGDWQIKQAKKATYEAI